MARWVACILSQNTLVKGLAASLLIKRTSSLVLAVCACDASLAIGICRIRQSGILSYIWQSKIIQRIANQHHPTYHDMSHYLQATNLE